MKVVRKELPKEFEPFEITISVENETEFLTLKNLFNGISAASLNNAVQNRIAPNAILNLNVLVALIEKFSKILNI